MTNINNNKNLLEGFFKVADAVSQTMGAQGKLSIIENKSIGNPIVTKDGISTAKEIFFQNSEQNIGAHLAKQVAAKTLVSAGDNTTTSLVLARGLVKNAYKKRNFFSRGEYFFNKRVEKGMEIGLERVNEYLEIYSQPVTNDIIQQIATISGNNNKEIGELVFEAYSKVGENGIIGVLQDQTSIKSYVKSSDGMRLDKGWMNPFLTNNQKNAKWEATDAVVIVYEGYLQSDLAVQDALNENSDKPIIIIAERFHEDTLIKLTELAQSKTLNITAVQAPDYDNKRKAYLEDIALYTNAEVFLQGGKNEKILTGLAKRVVVTEDSCEIVMSKLSKAVKNKVKDLKSQLDTIKDKDFIQKRIQGLEGKSSTIYVGGITNSEIKEKFDRFEDAVCSVQSAVKEGWVVGGGSVLAYISEQMKGYNIEDTEVRFGYNLVRKTLIEPMKQICINARREPSSYIYAAKKNYGRGYNAYTDELVDLEQDRIVDSKKSLRVALENAVSVTKLLLNVGVIISEGKEEKKSFFNRLFD